MNKHLIAFLLWITAFTGSGFHAFANDHEPYVKVILINPIQHSVPEAYLNPASDLVTDSMVLHPHDTLALLNQMVDHQVPIIETDCFYPDLKLVYKDHTYILSTHCASIYKFKNDAPYVSGDSRLANDFIFTEGLILYFQHLKKVRLGNNNERFFASLSIPSALSQFRKNHPNNHASTSGEPFHKKQNINYHQSSQSVSPLAKEPNISPLTVTDVSPPKEDNYEQLFNYPALIRQVLLSRPSGDTLLYTDKTDLKSYVYFTQQNIPFKPILYTGNNTLRFDFDAPTNFKPLNFVFQWKLEGQEDQWTEWTDQKSVTFTGLIPHTYKLKVRAKDSKERISNEASFEFTVLPRWTLEGSDGNAPFAVIRRVLLKRASYDSVLYRNSLILASSAEDVQVKKPLTLAYNAQSLRFEFSRPDGEGSKIYQYYMEGADPTWREWTADAFGDYPYLAPGSYHFYLRLKQPNGHYSQEASIPIVVREPWHASGIFYGSVLSVFLLLAGIALAGQPREKWEGKVIASSFFIGATIVGEIISHQLHQSHYFDPDLVGVLKIGFYGTCGIILAMLPFTRILDRIDPKYARGSSNKLPAAPQH